MWNVLVWSWRILNEWRSCLDNHIENRNSLIMPEMPNTEIYWMKQEYAWDVRNTHSVASQMQMNTVSFQVSLRYLSIQFRDIHYHVGTWSTRIRCELAIGHCWFQRKFSDLLLIVYFIYFFILNADIKINTKHRTQNTELCRLYIVYLAYNNE